MMKRVKQDDYKGVFMFLITKDLKEIWLIGGFNITSNHRPNKKLLKKKLKVSKIEEPSEMKDSD